MSEVFPENEYRHCAVHIGRNMVGRFKVKSLAALVYNAAKKATKEECDRWLEEIKKASEGAFEYINSTEHKLWATYAMDKPNYGHATSNIAESNNNSVLKEDMTLTVYGVFSEYYKRLAFQYEQRAEHIKGCTDNDVCPKALKKDKETIESSRRIGANFSFVPDFSSGNSCDGSDDA